MIKGDERNVINYMNEDKNEINEYNEGNIKCTSEKIHLPKIYREKKKLSKAPEFMKGIN